MKFSLSLLIFLVMTSEFAFAEMPVAAVPTNEQQKVLLLLNNICGDAWCEGAYDINFKSIDLDSSKSAYILAAATSADQSDSSTAVAIPFFCEIKDKLILETITTSSHDRLAFEAEQKLFQIISDCIDTALYSKLH